MTLEEALNIAYSSNVDIDSIYIEPPEATALTDEESGDEEDCDVNHLSGGQLAAKAEVVLTNNERIGSFEETNNLPQNISSASTSVRNCTEFSWIDGDLVNQEYEFPSPSYDKYMDKSIIEIFELFFDDEIIEYLIEQSKLYAQFKTNPDPNISVGEMRCTIAILILSGYNKLPGKRFYWDTGNDMKNNSVTESMRRNRFFKILQFLHCADNNNPNLKDKAWKIRPLMDKLKERFLAHFVPEQHISYDETMVKYYGQHGCKQFIRGKPIRFGFKMWSLNTSSGYLLTLICTKESALMRTKKWRKFSVSQLNHLSECCMRYLMEKNSYTISFILIICLQV